MFEKNPCVVPMCNGQSDGSGINCIIKVAKKVVIIGLSHYVECSMEKVRQNNLNIFITYMQSKDKVFSHLLRLRLTQVVNIYLLINLSSSCWSLVVLE